MQGAVLVHIDGPSPLVNTNERRRQVIVFSWNIFSPPPPVGVTSAVRNGGIPPFLRVSRSLYPSLRTKDAYKVIRMAAPFKDPRTDIFYFRRVVPEPLRPYFGEQRTEYKRSLDTRDPAEARERYPAHAVIYEQKLAAARRALLNQHSRSATAMVDAYLADRYTVQLQRMAMKLAMLEAGSFGYPPSLREARAEVPGATIPPPRFLQRTVWAHRSHGRVIRGRSTAPA